MKDKKIKHNMRLTQMEYKIEIFREMMDVLEGGDIRLDMPDINTSDIETILTILSAFIDKTSARLKYEQSDEYTKLEAIFESIK
jgi:hypothetical protein